MQEMIRQAKPSDASRVACLLAVGRRRAYLNDSLGYDAAHMSQLAVQQLLPSAKHELAVNAERARLYPEHSLFLVCDQPGRQSLAAMEYAYVKNGEAYLDRLFVARSCQSKGIGSLLMQKFFEWAPEGLPQTLEVVSHNQKAINFYERHDFAIRPDSNYIWEGMDTVIMERTKGQETS